MEFKPESQEVVSNKNEKIEGCTTLDELYGVLSEMDAIQSTSGEYSGADVRDSIEEVRHGRRNITYITRADGIRNKALTLLLGDSIYKEEVLAKKAELLESL